MQSLIITNIGLLAGLLEQNKLLRGDELKEIQTLRNTFLHIEDDLIRHWGAMQDLDNYCSKLKCNFNCYNAQQATILPCWCDSHTHIVFAATREDEFVDKIKGLSYAEIAAKGGGILNSAKRLQETPEDELFDTAWNRLQQLIRQGTGAIEIKSGYGLTVDAELKMLRVIRRLKETAPIPVKASFLGAHAYPPDFKANHAAYIRLLTDELLPEIAKQQLADYIDVFCEQGFFSVDEMVQIIQAGARYGLVPKLHVNQLNSFGGLQAAIECNALSVDHLEVMTENDIAALAASNTIGTMLPTAAYFLRMAYQPARQMIDAGCAVALASDYNPGSSPGGNMHTVVSMSCVQMRMLPEEAINAATINGAYAMQCESVCGSITAGKKANLIFMPPMQSLAYIPYAFSSALAEQVMINGSFFNVQTMH